MSSYYEPITQFEQTNQYLTQKPPSPAQILIDMLGYLGRPLQGVIGGVSGVFPREGGPQDPLTGISMGLAGGSATLGGPSLGQEYVPHSFAGELHARFPDEPTLSAGPFDVRPSMVAGLPLDVALDPLTYVGGAIAGLRKGGQVARLAPGEAAMAAITPQSSIDEIQRAMLLSGVEQSMKTQAGRFASLRPEVGAIAAPEQSGLGALVEKVSRAPLAGRAVKSVYDRMSPVQMQSPLGKLTTSYKRVQELVGERVPAELSELYIHPGRQSFLDRLRDGHKVLLDTGQEVMVDVFRETPALWQHVDKPLQEYARFSYDIIADYKSLMQFYGINIQDTAKLVGTHFFPRPTKLEAQNLRDMLAGFVSVSRQRGFLDDRELKSMAQGLAIGHDYLDDFADVVGYWGKEASRQIADKQFADELLSRGIAAGERLAPTSGQPLVRGNIADLWFKADDVKFLENAFRVVDPTLQRINNASGLSRMFTASIDFSNAMIQGLPWLARDPVGFFKAWGQQFKFFADPIELRRFLAQPKQVEILERMPQLATSMSEYFEGLRMLNRLPQAQQIIGRFQAAFDGFGMMQRMAFAEALLPAAVRLGQVDQITDYINKASGVTSTIGLGISDTQRAVESSVMFFSPRYTRAALMLLGDVIWTPLSYAGMGSIKMANEEAAKTLSAMLAAGTLWYQKAAWSLGQEPQLDPTKASFMTLDMEGSRVGIGSIWVSLARVLSRITTYPNKVVSLDPTENPIAQFMRSRLAPMGSLFADKLLYGETYIGEPLESLPDNLKYLSTKFMPFALENLIFQRPAFLDDPAAKAGLTVAEVFGGRTFPEGYAELVDNKAREMFSDDFDNLSAFEQADVRNDPEIKKIPPPPGKSGERIKQFDSVNEAIYSELEVYAKAVNDGEITRRQFREYYTDLMKRRAGRLEQIDEEHPGYRDQRAVVRFGKKFDLLSFEDQKWLESRDGLPAIDDKERYRRKYLSILLNSTATQNIEGNVWEDAENYLASIPEYAQKWIEDKELADTARYPGATRKLLYEWRVDRRKLDGYWEITDDVLKSMGMKEYWEDMSPAMRVEFQKTPTWQVMNRIMSSMKRYWRLSHPEAEEALLRWGYVTTSIWQQL